MENSYALIRFALNKLSIKKFRNYLKIFIGAVKIRRFSLRIQLTFLNDLYGKVTRCSTLRLWVGSFIYLIYYNLFDIYISFLLVMWLTSAAKKRSIYCRKKLNLLPKNFNLFPKKLNLGPKNMNLVSKNSI